MNEIAIRNSADLAPAEAPVSPLVLWAYQAQQAHQIAQSLAKTSFVPTSLRGKPDDITAAILAGDELGLRPMASLRSMDVIQGTPALRAHAMRGLVQSRGHEVELVESTDDRCVMAGRRKDSDGRWQTVEWTIDRAAKLGLTGKDQWKKQPRTMLVARATGEICRLVASDVLYAMPYAAEELDGDQAVADVAGTRITAADILGQAAGKQPEPDPAAGAHSYATEVQERREAGRAEPGITNPQQKKLHALLNENELGNRADGLAYISGILDRNVASTKDLTKAEAGTVIDRLEANTAPAEPPVDEAVAIALADDEPALWPDTTQSAGDQ